MKPDETWLLKEILQQPQVLQRVLDRERRAVARVAAVMRRRRPRYLVFAARGSSDNAARYAKYLFGAQHALPVALATPSLFTLYRRPPNLQGSVVFGISQSGQSPDIVAVVREGRRQGVPTVGITNEPDSPLARACDMVVQLHAGVERSIAATKTYTASLACLALLSAELSGDREHLRALQALPERLAAYLHGWQEATSAATRYRGIQGCVAIGRGFNYATAFEISLKLTELTYALAEPYSPADFMHGPVALVSADFPVLAVAHSGAAYEQMLEFLGDMRARGARIIAISNRPQALGLAKTALPALPEDLGEWLSPIFAVIPGQLFALGLALAKGLDPDRPRGLRKITRTR
jgi:glucosamine--fructose-6-phosphate aminotransferase (isomerizing)